MHQTIIQSETTSFESLPLIAPSPLLPAVLLHMTPFVNKYIFSCTAAVGHHESGKRTIVSLQRDGRWHCQSCRYSETCKHRPHAIAYAVSAGLTLSTDVLEQSEDTEDALLINAATRIDDFGKILHAAISYYNVLPPRWCSLPSESAYNAPHLSFNTSSFSLDNSARCVCGITFTDVANFPPYRASSVKAAVIFGLTKSTLISIELLPCPVCCHPRRSLGADLGTQGLFNWNNEMLFTHELLNAFTSAFTASETPFSAFCITVRRAYLEHSHSMEFCSDETFVRVWFAFTQIQTMDSGMYCPTCGASPDVVIVDGISLGTHVSKLTGSIQPPTHVDNTSERVDSISSYRARGLPAIIQRDVRSVVNKIINLQTSDPFPDVTKLAKTYPELLAFIHLYLRSVNTIHQRSYCDLIAQVAAPDIVLQLIPVSAIEHLKGLQLQGTAPIWLQRLCPAIGAVLASHKSEGSSIPLEIRNLAGWLAERAHQVFTNLGQHDPGQIEQDISKENWQQTGTCYGLPAVRRRRVYPKLRYDTQPLSDRDAEEMGDCNKFYKTYSKNNLTGGIMVLWCTHSICLGFHSIPIAEGRNDVFSAIYTHFPIAPKVIIYDFACQLAPYCLVREARYFQNTQFLIDEMHARDHTHCGKACFASNAMRYDNCIRAINTSAAECGNKGLKRIRKSISFMVHSHAVQFTKVFLDVWNRGAIARMLKV